MNEKVKIKISEDAHVRLIDILKEIQEFSHVRFSYKDGCCGSTKIELYLDNAKPDDIISIIDELPIVYDAEVSENIKEITLVFRKGSFMIKTETVKPLYTDCSSCTKGCGKQNKDSSSMKSSCTGGNCNGCSKG